MVLLLGLLLALLLILNDQDQLGGWHLPPFGGFWLIPAFYVSIAGISLQVPCRAFNPGEFRCGLLFFRNTESSGFSGCCRANGPPDFTIRQS